MIATSAVSLYRASLKANVVVNIDICKTYTSKHTHTKYLPPVNIRWQMRNTQRHKNAAQKNIPSGLPAANPIVTPNPTGDCSPISGGINTAVLASANKGSIKS